MCAQSESRPPVQFALFHNSLSCGTNINAGSRSAPRASHQLLSSQLPEFPPQPLGCCRDCQLFPQPLRLINPAPQRFSQPLQSQAPTYRRATCHKKGSHRWKKKQRKNTLKNRRNINDKVKKMFTSNLLPVHLSQNVPTTPCLGHPYTLPVPRIHVRFGRNKFFVKIQNVSPETAQLYPNADDGRWSWCKEVNSGMHRLQL